MASSACSPYHVRLGLCTLHSLPIECTTKIPRGRLKTPLRPIRQVTDLAEEDFVLDEIQQLVEKAGHEVVILVDACTIRHSVKEEVWELIQRTGFPVYSAPMGKTAIPEDYERYGGVCYLSLQPLRL